jgi:hypothetical protein
MKRPFGVTLIGGLLLVQGAVLLVQVAADVWLLVTRGGVVTQPQIAVNIGELSLNEWLAAIVVGTLSITSIAVGIGMWRMRPLAWFLAMVLQGWTLATLLLDHFTRGGGNYASMLIAVIIVFYLNTRAVREPFDLARRRAAAGGTTPSPSPTPHGTTTVPAQQTTSLTRMNAPDATGS